MTLAVLWLGTVGAAGLPAPQLIVDRAQPLEFWTSATEAPVYASAGTASIDFWDSRDGTLLRTAALPQTRAQPESEPAPPPAVVVSNDGLRAAWASNGRITLISTRDGTLDTLWVTLSGDPEPVTFSPDARSLAVDVRPTPDPRSGQRANGSIALISIADGSVVRLAGGETDAAYSPDAHFVATLVHARDRLSVFDVRSGVVRTLSDGGGVYGPLAYSPDGALVASLGDDPSIPPNGKGIFEPNATSHELVVKLWDLRRGRLIARLPWRTVSNRLTLDERAPGAFAFGPAHSLAIATTLQTVGYNTLSLGVTWRLPRGDPFSIALPGQAATPYRVGGGLGFLAENATEIVFQRWIDSAIATDATIPFSAKIGNIAIDRLGRTLAVAGISAEGNRAAERDAAYGLDLLTLRWTPVAERQQAAKPIVFLADGRLALPAPCGLLYVDLRTGKDARHMVPGGLCAYPFPDFSLSTDGQTIFLGTDSGLLSPPGAVPETIPLRAYDAATGRRRYEVHGTTGLPLACASHDNDCVFPQRETTPNLGHQHDPVTLAVLDATTGKPVSTFGLHALIGGAGFVDSDRQLVIRETSYTNVEIDTIDVIDPLHGTLERQFRSIDGDITFAPFAPLFSITNRDATTIFNTRGAVLNTIPNTIAGESDNVTFFPDGSKLAIVEPDGTIAVRATRSGRLLVTLVFFSHQNTLDWLAFTPEGYYTGTPFAMSAIRWRIGDQTLPAAAFADQFHRPDRVAKAVAKHA